MKRLSECTNKPCLIHVSGIYVLHTTDGRRHAFIYPFNCLKGDNIKLCTDFCKESARPPPPPSHVIAHLLSKVPSDETLHVYVYNKDIDVCPITQRRKSNYKIWYLDKLENVGVKMISINSEIVCGRKTVCSLMGIWTKMRDAIRELHGVPYLSTFDIAWHFLTLDIVGDTMRLHMRKVNDYITIYRHTLENVLRPYKSGEVAKAVMMESIFKRPVAEWFVSMLFPYDPIPIRQRAGSKRSSSTPMDTIGMAYTIPIEGCPLSIVNGIETIPPDYGALLTVLSDRKQSILYGWEGVRTALIYHCEKCGNRRVEGKTTDAVRESVLSISENVLWNRPITEMWHTIHHSKERNARQRSLLFLNALVAHGLVAVYIFRSMDMMGSRKAVERACEDLSRTYSTTIQKMLGGGEYADKRATLALYHMELMLLSHEPYPKNSKRQKTSVS